MNQPSRHLLLYYLGSSTGSASQKDPPSVSPRSGYMVSANIHARVDQLLLFGDGHPTFDDGKPNVLVSIHIGSMGLSPMMKV